MAPATITAVQPTAGVKYQFTPNIDFEHKDSFGNVISGYMKDHQYNVRNCPEHRKLDETVQKWMAKEAHDDNPNKESRVNLGHKLVRMGV